MLSAGIVSTGSETLVRPARVSGKIITHFRYLAGINTASGVRFIQVRDESGNVTTDTEAIMGNCTNPFIEIDGNLYYIKMCSLQQATSEILTIQATATGLPALTKNSTFTKLETFGSIVTESFGTLRERNFNDYDASSNPLGVVSMSTSADSGTVPASYNYTWTTNFGDPSFKTIFPQTSSSQQSAGLASHNHYVLRLIQ